MVNILVNLVLWQRKKRLKKDLKNIKTSWLLQEP